MIMTKLILVTVGLCVKAENSCDLIEWTGGQFDWPNSATKSIFKTCGCYIPKNIIATRAQIFKDEVYLAIPRLKPGVPVTLAKVGLKQKGFEAVLQPFPCWKSQEEGDCNAFQSVVDLYLDENNLLWVLDTGIVNILTQPIRTAPPKVVAIDILTEKMILTLDFSGLVCPVSRLQYIAVEYAPDGKPFIYVSDAATESILVFDVAKNCGFRVILPTEMCSCQKDVLYIALIHKPGCNMNSLLITYLSGTNLYEINTECLRTGTAFEKIENLGAKDCKIIIIGTDLGTAVFFRFEGRPEIYRWEVDSAFKNFELVYKSPECYFATHAIPDVCRHRIRVLESNFPDFIQGTVGCGTSQRVAYMISCLN